MIIDHMKENHPCGECVYRCKRQDVSEAMNKIGSPRGDLSIKMCEATWDENKPAPEIIAELVRARKDGLNIQTLTNGILDTILSHSS